MGFGWRISPVAGVYSGLDQEDFHSPSHALLIQFEGKGNVDYRSIYQFVRIEPGHAYRLRGFMKALGITTDSVPRLEVRDAYNPNVLDKFSDGPPGSTTGWTPLGLDFTSPPGTDLIVIGITRLPSKKFDNLISGKVWVDDLSLSELPAETVRAQ
jgi:hypothetical protein